MTNLQNKVFEVTNPIEIDKACEDIRQMLKNNISWISHPFHIAQRFLKRDSTSGRSFYYPETYVKELNQNNYNYHRLTPDNDYQGMLFFMVGAGRNDFASNQQNFITYPVGIIFSCNLELIDKTKLTTEYLFTQELIRSVRKELTNGMINFDFDYTIVSETRDLRECYREFTLEDIEQYNRAPLQCFRIDLQIRIQEDC